MKNSLLFSGLLLVGGMIAVVASRTGDECALSPPKAASIAVVPPVAESAVNPSAGAPLVRAPQMEAATAAAVASRAVRTIPRALSALLPELPAPVADWRTFTPKRIVVAPLPGLALEFFAESVTNDGKRTLWIGHNPALGTRLVASATETLWDAIVTVPGADEFTVHIDPTGVRVEEHTRALAVCAFDSSGTSVAPASAAAAAPSASAAPNTADILFLYDAATAAAIGTTAQIENTFTARVATMNTYLANSAVDNLQWRLAGIAQAPAYSTTTTMEDDLDKLADSRTELGQFARTQRAAVGADQVILIVTGSRDFAGIAHTPGYLAVARYDQGTAVIAHELGHNFGCHHDRETEEASDGNGRYYYGHRFNLNGRDLGTIMSYAAYYIPHFSNPAVNYQGIATGVDASQPKAADNARWLREHAGDIANLVPTKAVTQPMITNQPNSVTVTVGQALSLSVNATGNTLSYQWSKAGVDIPGATGATYSKTAGAGDAGTYTVLVSNSAGSVRSEPAVVTVNPASSGGGSSSGNSGGGGGGGALNLLTAVGCLTLLCVRRRAVR